LYILSPVSDLGEERGVKIESANTIAISITLKDIFGLGKEDRLEIPLITDDAKQYYGYQ
jgi:hypothetical protein